MNELPAIRARGGVVLAGPHESEADCNLACNINTGTGLNPGTGTTPFTGTSVPPISTASPPPALVPDDCGCGADVDPMVYRIEFTGVVNGCTGCDLLNGIHDLVYAGKISGLCYWTKYLGAPVTCGLGPWLTFVTDGTVHELLVFTPYLALSGEFAYSGTTGSWTCGEENTLMATETVDCIGLPPTLSIVPVYE